jgi:SAM-dependent methyltransferase
MSRTHVFEENLFPRLYHAHHSRHAEDIAFWIGLAHWQGSPILELGCGTGRVLLALRREGLAAFGLDSDLGMLQTLKGLAPPGEAAPVWAADMAAFSLARSFAFILIPCNTFSTLGPSTRLSTLQTVARHLQPGGLFAFSVPNPEMLLRLPRRSEPEFEEMFPHPVDGEPVQVSSGWARAAQYVTFTWVYDHLLPDGTAERFETRARHELTPLSVYREELCQAGLRIETTFGDYDHSPCSPDAPHWIALARKA